MKKRVSPELRARVDAAFEQINERDVEIPDYFKIFSFEGRKSPIVAKKIISKITDPGDVILDPFFGTGSFLIAAQQSGRKSIGIELDNMTFFFVKNLLLRVDFNRLSFLFNQVENSVSETIMRLYETRLDGNIYHIRKLHFDPVDNEYYNPRNHRDIKNGNNIQLEETYPNGRRIYKRFDAFDEAKLRECQQLDVSRFPHHRMIENSRINITAATGADYYDKNFNNRQKYSLLLLQDAINNLPESKERDVLEITLISCLALARIAPYGDNTNYLYHVTQHSAQERNVWTLFKSKYEAVLDYKERLLSCLQDSFNIEDQNQISLFEGDYAVVLERYRGYFDCIYTDPPYSDQVPYLERSQLFRDWINEFYHDGFSLSETALEREVVVSDAPSRPNKNLDNYYRDVRKMMAVFASSLKENGLLALTIKLANRHYFRVLTEYIDSARNAGFEFVGSYSLDCNDPTIRRQAAYLSTMMKQIIIVFQKLPQEKQYWFISEINAENEVIKTVYDAIEQSENRMIDLTEAIHLCEDHFRHNYEIVLDNDQLHRASDVIKDSFSLMDHFVQLDSSELYLGLENDPSLLIKLYDIIPIKIRQLLSRDQHSFCKDDLYAEIAYLLFDGNNISLFNHLLRDGRVRDRIEDIVDNYCVIENGRYVARQIQMPHGDNAIDISTLGGYELEQLMRNLLTAEGYRDVVRTGKSGDRGVDLIATQVLPDGSTQKVIFQCKRWIANVGSTPIQRLHSMMVANAHQIRKAVCVTTSSYTREGMEAARETGVELINGRELIARLQRAFGNRYYHGALNLLPENE